MRGNLPAAIERYEIVANRATDATLRAAPEFLAGNTLGQSGLWSHGVSGDLPILIVRAAKS